MKYEKAQVEVIQFTYSEFLTASNNYSSVFEALSANCGGYSPKNNGKGTNNFDCGVFGGYSPSNPPTQKSTVTLGGGTYEFDYVGNHWKCSIV